MNNKIIILTGAIQTGKTTLLQQFCLQQQNVAGILTPVINGRRMFYNIAGGIFFEMEAEGEEEKLSIGKYVFSAAAFTKANTILSAAANNSAVEYLIIDEVGPLEIKQQKGLYPSYQKILSSTFNFTLVIVVRQSLAETVIATLPSKNISILNVKEMRMHFNIPV